MIDLSVCTIQENIDTLLRLHLILMFCVLQDENPMMGKKAIWGPNIPVRKKDVNIQKAHNQIIL